jgi:hypothetical protein
METTYARTPPKFRVLGAAVRHVGRGPVERVGPRVGRLVPDASLGVGVLATPATNPAARASSLGTAGKHGRCGQTRRDVVNMAIPSKGGHVGRQTATASPQVERPAPTSERKSKNSPSKKETVRKVVLRIWFGRSRGRPCSQGAILIPIRASTTFPCPEQ